MVKTTNEKPQTTTAIFGRVETERASKFSKRRAGVKARISVRLDADVPSKELEDLVSLSYDLVCSGLTKKQRAELALSASSENVGGSDACVPARN